MKINKFKILYVLILLTGIGILLHATSVVIFSGDILSAKSIDVYFDLFFGVGCILYFFKKRKKI
jgi:hypothetical protein